MAANRKFVLLCAFVVGAVAVPVVREEQCARYCTEEHDFLLRSGSVYTYDYETTTVTAVQGSFQDKTQLQLTAQVDIEVLSKCDLSLRLRGVTLKLSDPESPDYLNTIRGARDFAKSVERHVLRFSFQNGKVEHVCPKEDVPDWVLNIQKGVLSAFQSYVVKPDWTTRALETDVLGKCTAEYHSLGTSWQGTHTIRKLKDLSSCTDRENVETYLQGTPYADDFERRSLPLVKGSQECEQVIGDGFLKTSTCSEKLVFRPFSNGGSGVVTTVTQKLSYATISRRTFTGTDYRPTTESLLFRHSKQEDDPSKREEQTEQALKDLCEASQQDISITVPKKFSAFVYKLKKLPVESLRSLYQRAERICPENSKSRKFFMDAIPLVATSDSAKFMYEMITRNVVTEAESKFWLTSLSFISEPTADIISTFTPLLDGRHEQALLGVSALIHTFCKSNDCYQSREVEAAVSKLVQNLGDNCYSAEDKKTILTLKALSNIGIMFDRQRILTACYKNPQLRTEVRLAAIQAFRRVSCDVNREDLFNTYRNYNEDSEIRIAAYLAVMNCPTASTVSAVRDVLMTETINHVGSFVWTHLTALAKSKHPERKAFREIVSNLYLLNKYQGDVRKFSSAHEATFFLESIDSGFHVDSHLIFSTDSYLPKSAMFNLTVDVFGKTCNLFQIDGRMEGLERVVESFFGPSGYFPQKNIAKILREKRSISNNKIDDMDEKFQAKSRFSQEPYGSLDVKVFGSSLWYSQFRQNDDSAPDINLLELVTKLAEEQEKEYSRSFMFLDTTFTVPMTSGLPLRIAVNGTASVNLKIGGKFDVKSMQHVDVLGNIEPSGAIEIASLLTVDAGTAARSGLRVVGTMHSSTVLNGRVEVRNGEVAKVQLNMPRDRIDVFNMQSKVYLLHGTNEKEQKADKKDGAVMKSCSGNTISTIFGVKFCSELQLPPYKPNSPLHPVNGPASFSLYILKTDQSLKSYDFDAMWRNDGKNINGMISLNTPQSEIDRDVKMEISLNKIDHTATFKVKSPMKKLSVKAKFLNVETQKKIDLGVDIDDKNYFSMQADLQSSGSKDSLTYEPSFEIRIPSRRLAAVTGSFNMRTGQKYMGQIKVEDLTQRPILAKGSFELGRTGRYIGELTLNSFVIDGTVKGYAQAGDSMSTKINAEYKFLDGIKNKINFQGKVRNLSANALMKYTGLVNLETSLLPEWNTEVSFETMQTTGHIENSVAISLGDGVRSRMHKIRMQKIIKYEGNLKNNKISSAFSLSYPEKNIDYSLELNQDMNINERNTVGQYKNSMKLVYDARKQLNSDLMLDINLENSKYVTADMKVNYPGRESKLRVELSEEGQKEFKGVLSCQWQSGKVATAQVRFKDMSDGGLIKYELESGVNLPWRNPIISLSTVTVKQGWYSAHSELTTGLDKYRAKADVSVGNGINHRMMMSFVKNNDLYSLEMSVQNIRNKINSQFELKRPHHQRIASKFEGRFDRAFKTATLEVLWDADRDTSKRFGLNGEIRKQNDGYDGKFTVQIRRRTITGFLQTNLQGELLSRNWRTENKLVVEWSPAEKAALEFSAGALFDRSRQQINNHIEISTPYYGYENITFNLNHEYSNQQWQSEMSSFLPGNNRILLSSNGKYSFTSGGASLETRAQFQSSWKKMEEASFALSHDHSLKELSSKAEISWGKEQALMQISGVKQDSMITGSFKINSPFDNFRDVSAEVTQNMAPGNYKTRGTVQWASRRRISFNFEGIHMFQGRRRICTITLTTSTPFRGYENCLGKGTYSNDGSVLSTDMEMTWNRNKVAASFNGSMRKGVNDNNLEAKLQFTSPFKNYEHVMLSSSLELSRNSYKINIDTQLQNRPTVSFNSQGKMKSLSDIEVNAVVISQIPRYIPERATIDFVHKLQDSSVRTSLDTFYGDRRFTVLVQGLHENAYGSRNAELSVVANTPFFGYEDMKLEFAHNSLGYEYNTKMTLNKNEKSGSVVHKLLLRDALNLETNIELTSNVIPHAKMSLSQKYDDRLLEHRTDIVWDRSKKINVNAQLLTKPFSKEFSFKVNTPFRTVREVEFKTSIDCQNWDHKGSMSAQWNKYNKVTLNGDLRNYRWQNVNSRLEFSSTLNGYEFYSVAAKYDLTAPQKSAEFTYEWDSNNKKAVTVKGNYLLTYSLKSAEFVLTTPFKEVNNLNLGVSFVRKPSQKNLNVMFHLQGERNFQFNAKSDVRNGKGEISYDLNNSFGTTLKQTKGHVKYANRNDGMNGEILGTWNDEDKFHLTSELKAAYGKLRISASTPIYGYEKLILDVEGDFEQPEKPIKVTCRWGADGVLSVGTRYKENREQSELITTVTSSFENYRSVIVRSEYTMRPGSYAGSILATVNDRNAYEGSVNFANKANNLELSFSLNTPHPPLRNVQISSNLDWNGESKSFDGILKWEGKEAKITFSHTSGAQQNYKSKLRIETPFKNYRLFSCESSLRLNGMQSINGRMSVITPFKSIRTLDLTADFKNDNSGSSLSFEASTPEEKLSVEGKVSNRQFQPLIVSLDIDAPFLKLQKVSSRAEVNVARWNNSKAKLSTNSPFFNHALNVELLAGKTGMGFEGTVESTAIASGKVRVSVKANYIQNRDINADATVELFNNVHSITAQFVDTGREMRIESRVDSSLLPENELQVVGVLSRRRSKVDLKISFTVPSATHKVETKYEAKGNQITANMKVDSDILPFSSVDSQVKYINNNYRDIETELSIKTPDSVHSIVWNAKNYPTEKFAEIKINCPFSEYLDSFSVTGSFKNNNDAEIDGSLSVSSMGKDIRIAGNMKNTKWESVEAFLTINTPFQVMQWGRMNVNYNNDKYQEFSCNFDVETSNPNLRLLGVTSKLSRSKGAEDMSLMFRLPLKNYQTIQLLVNGHYAEDFSSADSRATLTLPRNKYSIYGQYGNRAPRVSGTAELEANGKKWMVSGRVERTNDKKDVSVSFTLPSNDKYDFGGVYGGFDDTRYVSASYISPKAEKYHFNSSVKFSDLTNFDLEVQIESPFENYRTLQSTIRQQYNSNYQLTNVEYTKNGRKGFFKLLHRIMRNRITGTVQMGCPYTKLRDLKLSYNHDTKSNDKECSFQLDYNRVKQFKAELMRFGGKSSHIILDVPVLPLTITANIKYLDSGKEVNFKSDYYSRVMSFRSSYQQEQGQLLHDAAFSWDEGTKKRVSYEFKLSDTETGKELWSRLDTPVRSLMLKGNFTKTSRSRSGGVDFYWDASRSHERHMAVGIEHSDMSKGRTNTHRVQITVEHPKLARAIVQANTLSFGPSELLLKSELLYSRLRHRDVVLELKANDLSRNRGETHYKGEMMVRHPSSRLDMRAAAEVMDSKIESSAYLKFNNLDSQQAQNIREIRAKIFKIRQQIDIMMKSNENEINYLGEVSGRGGDMNLSIERKLNEKRDFNAQVNFSRRNKALDLSVLNSENTGVQASAAFPKDSVSLKISHSKRGNIVTDVNMYLGLEESKVLKSQINWRPRMWRELRIATGETLRAILKTGRDSHQELSNAISEEWNTKSSLISRDMAQELSPFFNELRSGVSEIGADYQRTKNAFWDMYRNNEFYMKDIVRGYKSTMEMLRETMDHLALGYEVLWNIIVEQVEDLYYRMYYSCLDMIDYAKDLRIRLSKKASEFLRTTQEKLREAALYCCDKIGDGMKYISSKVQTVSEKIILRLDKLVRAYAPCLIDGYFYIKHFADDVRYWFNNMYNKASDGVFNNRYYVALSNYVSTVMDTIQAFGDYGYAAWAQATMNNIYDVQLLDAIVNHPNIEYMSGAAKSALVKSLEIYHKLGLDVAYNAASQSISNYVKTKALSTAQDLFSEFYDLRGGVKYEFQPQRGLVSLELMLPSRRNSLIEVFDFKSYPEFQKAMTMQNTLMAEYYEDFCIWDFYYKIVNYLTPSYWLPSFNAHAVLSGNQHYITFDKLPFAYAGRCSYLLARDFVDGNFSAIVNYGDDHIRKSLTILTEGKKVDIASNYKITVDDKKMESPLQMGNTVVIREGTNMRIENEKKGFSLVCNFVHNYCSLSLSGFYFGKTGGLFGTYNYEPQLDMMTPNRLLAADLETFASSWEVGKTVCRSSENLATLPSYDARVQEKCRNLFQKSSSGFRACFKQVNPEAFLKMCVNDLSAVHQNQYDEAICQSAAAYFYECKMEGVPLKMPSNCVRCEKQDGTSMKEGDALRFPKELKPGVADVVFLVEEKDCNRDRVKYLSKLAQGIEDNFRQKNYHDVRYSVVAFGGSKIHSAPHVHTMDGQESGSFRSLDSAIYSLEFGDGPNNVLEALRFAAALNLRPGATNTFVLMKCSTCKSEELKAEYSETLRTLSDAEITLHVLMEQKFEMKEVPNKNSKARRVIGVDKRFAYTLKDVKNSDLSGDGDLLAQLRIPKDVCIPLALEVKGSNFDSQFLTEVKKNTNKKFMDVLARVIVKSSTEEERAKWGMCCECIATDDGVGKSTCQRCVSAEVASMISADIFSINNIESSSLETREKSKSRVRKHKERTSGL
ncbi:apolipophorins-like [Uloborus diversus]|uniref:apolipophorins-like n=1 Tax=Uloborus diversus TaxID=327109 RepID=UPI00240A0F95|nr:apolipophorins-like [Uloborus diversus]